MDPDEPGRCKKRKKLRQRCILVLKECKFIPCVFKRKFQEQGSEWKEMQLCKEFVTIQAALQSRKLMADGCMQERGQAPARRTTWGRGASLRKKRNREV